MTYKYHRLMLEGHCVGFSRRNGKAIQFRTFKAGWSRAPVKHDDAILITSLPAGYDDSRKGVRSQPKADHQADLSIMVDRLSHHSKDLGIRGGAGEGRFLCEMRKRIEAGKFFTVNHANKIVALVRRLEVL